MDLGAWLRGLGLGRYEQAFRDNDVDAGLLARLTAEDLKEIGVASVGDRRRLLDAITALRGGEPVPPDAGAAERRQLTVLFADLVGSTALSRQLDPEDLQALLRAYHACTAEAVAGAGGYVAKYMGDGVLAYFGWPEAHEDDAERAIRAGLSLAAAVPLLPCPTGGPLQARIGIATGLAVVGEPVGSGVAREEAVVGETPNLAARLQALAEPGSVVVAEATRRLVGPLFACAELGPVAAKGFAEPIRAFRVLGEGAAESRSEALHGAALTPLVGRAAELGLLLRLWREARSGQGRVALVSGEPGIGKSRLLAALEGRLAAEPHVALRYFCSPHHQDSPLHPIVAQLERAAGFERGDAPGARREKLRRLLAPAAPTAEEEALLAEHLGLPAGGPALRLTPQQKRERVFAALLRQLAALARQGPVLMAFEDVHWIDPSSLELLGLVVERAATLPVLLVVTFRPEFRPPWAGRPHVTALPLDRLGQEDGALLARQVARGTTLPDAMVATIMERTDGVPLFVEELTKAVLEAGAGAAAVPVSLHASLLARLDRLGPAARAAAQVGAAIGREFPFELAAAVAGRGKGELAGALGRLARAGLLFAHGTPPEATYLFKHALVRDAAYGTLLRERRRQLHGRIADALEAVFPDRAEATPELVAHHLTEAGEAERAVRWWLEAGRRSADRSADREAVHQLRRGLDLLAGLPASEGRDRLELELQLAIGTPLIALSGWSGEQVATAYERAAALCESLGDAERLGPTLFGLASNRVVRGETRSALRFARRCRELGEKLGHPACRLLAHRAMGAALMQLGAFAEARAELERIAALYDPERDRSLAATCITDPRVSGLSFLALVLWITGWPGRARAAAEEAARHAAALGHANTTGHVLCHGGGELAEFLRDAPAARARAEAVLALAAEHDMPMWRGYGVTMQGWVAAQEGRGREGAALVRQGIAMLDALGTVFHRTWHLAILAAIHAGLGETAAGLQALEEARAEAARTEARFCEAELHRLEGELRAQAGAPDAEVEACFARALALAREQGARSFELRAATSLARHLRDRGRRAEARGLLAPVYGWFSEGLGTPDLVDAKALLDLLAADG